MDIDDRTPTADVRMLTAGYTREQGAHVAPTCAVIPSAMLLEDSRARILDLPALIRVIPGHGPPFSPPRG